MVLADLIGFFVDAPERIALGIGLIGMLLYHRKVTRLGSVFQSLTARVAFGLALVGALLLTGIIPGLNVDVAVGYGEQLLSIGGDAVAAIQGAISG